MTVTKFPGTTSVSDTAMRAEGKALGKFARDNNYPPIKQRKGLSPAFIKGYEDGYGAPIKNKPARNPVPEGSKTKIAKARRRYESFRDQKASGVYQLDDAPDYTTGAKMCGLCTAIRYTTWRGAENNKELYEHKFLHRCAPVVMKSCDGHYFSEGGHYRFTYRGFLDQPKSVSKAGKPPFSTGLVVGYLDALIIGKHDSEKKISFGGKKVLLCVSESGYNFFTVQEPK